MPSYCANTFKKCKAPQSEMLCSECLQVALDAVKAEDPSKAQWQAMIDSHAPGRTIARGSKRCATKEENAVGNNKRHAQVKKARVDGGAELGGDG